MLQNPGHYLLPLDTVPLCLFSQVFFLVLGARVLVVLAEGPVVLERGLSFLESGLFPSLVGLVFAQIPPPFIPFRGLRGTLPLAGTEALHKGGVSCLLFLVSDLSSFLPLGSVLSSLSSLLLLSGLVATVLSLLSCLSPLSGLGGLSVFSSRPGS